MKNDGKDVFYRTLDLDIHELKALKHFKKVKLAIHKDEENQKSLEEI